MSSVQLVTAGLFLANAVLRGRDLDVTATPVGPIILSVVGLLTLTVGAALEASWSTATAAGSSSSWSPPRSSAGLIEARRPRLARTRGRQAVLGAQPAERLRAGVPGREGLTQLRGPGDRVPGAAPPPTRPPMCCGRRASASSTITTRSSPKPGSKRQISTSRPSTRSQAAPGGRHG